MTWRIFTELSLLELELWFVPIKLNCPYCQCASLFLVLASFSSSLYLPFYLLYGGQQITALFTSHWSCNSPQENPRLLTPLRLFRTVPYIITSRVTRCKIMSFTLHWWHMVPGGTWCHCWLRHCATSRKVESSIPKGVIGIILWLNPSGRTLVPNSTQPLGVKAAGAYSWQRCHLHVPTV